MQIFMFISAIIVTLASMILVGMFVLYAIIAPIKESIKKKREKKELEKKELEKKELEKKK